MKHFICSVISLCLCFCNCFAQTSDKKLSGVYLYMYMSKGYKYPMQTINLKINKDGTYIYEDRIGLNLEYSKGYWSSDPKKKKLFLNGLISSTNDAPMVVKERCVKDSSIQVIFNSAFNTMPKWSIVLNNREYPINPDSVFSIKNINRVDSFFIKGFLDVEYMRPMPEQRHVRTITYYPQKGSNYYNISFPDSFDYYIFNYVPLQDTLHIKGCNLVWKRKIWNEPIKLKKQKEKK